MKGRTIGALVLTGVLALGGCKDYSQYNYNGKINEDHVTFISKFDVGGKNNNILLVTKPDGRVIKYDDSTKGDLILESVKITKNTQSQIYTSWDEFGTIILEEAQKQFDNYLQQIKEIKINQGLENLK